MKNLIQKLAEWPTVRRNRYYSPMIQSCGDFQYFLDQMIIDLSSNPSIRFEPSESNNKKYQSAIYELFNSEISIYCNINKLIHIYQKPMLNYGIISTKESEMIFSDLTRLSEIHRKLIENLSNIQIDGIFGCPVQILLEFSQSLNYYEVYCLNLIESKSILRKKMQQKPFVDYLRSDVVQRYAQRLDLASHLDQPRRHLMKYPLLVTEITRRTTCPEQIRTLRSVNEQITKIISNLDYRIAAGKYQKLIRKLNFPEKHYRLRQRMETTCSTVVIQAKVCRWRRPKTWPRYRLILMDQMLILVKRSSSALRSMYHVISGITTEIDHLNYSLKKQTNTEYHWLRLYYSSMEQTNQTDRNFFDITIRFQYQDEIGIWIRKLKLHFNLICSNTYPN